MPHSKRNTSSAFFTSYERSLLRNSWGSQSTRLTRDSFLPFASCKLCLLPAREPVACSGGLKADIFCRECALNDLVAQRKEVKRLEREWQDRQTEKGEGERLAKEEEVRKELQRFERTAQGLEAGIQLHNGRGKKRKAEELGRADDADGQSSKQTNEKTEASFWVPGVDANAPTTGTHSDEKPSKLRPICPGSTPSTKHPYSLKSLIEVKFSEEEGSSASEAPRVCPACTKKLSNGSKGMLAKPCGHVVCGSCVEKFIKPPETLNAHDPRAKEKHGRMFCYVCETDVTAPQHRIGNDKEGKTKIRPGLVEINCEGTGFAGGGTNMTKRDGVTFQC